MKEYVILSHKGNIVMWSNATNTPIGLINSEDRWATLGMMFHRDDFQCIWENEFGEQSLCLHDINRQTDNCFLRIKFKENVKH